MLKRKYRLSAGNRLQQPSVIHTQFFTLNVAKSSLPYNRYGFVISKKIDKRASVRNKAKRKLRWCVEKIQERVPGGHDMIFYLKKNVIQTPSSTLCSQMEHIFKKEKLLI